MTRAATAAPRGTSHLRDVPRTAVATGLAGGLVALPLVVDPWALDPHLPARWVVAGALCVLGTVTWWLRGPRDAGPPPAVVAGWALTVVAAAVAASAAPVPVESWLGDPARRGGVLSLPLLAAAYLVGRAAAVRRERLVRVAPPVTAALLAVTGWHLATAGAGAPVQAVVGNAGQFGGYLVVLAGLDVAVARGDADPSWRRAGRVSASAAAGLVVLTGSVAAVLAMVVLAVVVFHDVARSRGWSRGRRGLLLAVPVTATAAVWLAWPAGARGLMASLVGRWDTWRVAFDAVAARPLTGWGPDGFRHGFASQTPAEYVARYGAERITDRAHSLPLDVLGAGGLLLGVAVLLLAVALARDRDRHHPPARWIGHSLLGAGVFLLGWFPTVDLALVLATLVGATARVGPTPAAPTGPGRRRALTGFVAVVLAGTLLAVAVGARGVLEDRRVAAVATRAGGEGPALVTGAPGHQSVTQVLAALPALQQGDDLEVSLATATAVAHAADAERLVVAAQLQASVGAVAGDAVVTQRAAGTFRDALRLAPQHPTAWHGLGQALLRRQDPAAGEALERAAALRPHDPAPRYDLAVHAVRQGDPRGARTWLVVACELAPDDPQVQALARSLAVRCG